MTDEIQKIPIEDIDIPKSMERDVGDLEDISNNIKALGLLQPIAVRPKPENKPYGLLVGYRRYSAFVELNKKYPGEGWDKIPAFVLDDYDGGRSNIM